MSDIESRQIRGLPSRCYNGLPIRFRGSASGHRACPPVRALLPLLISVLAAVSLFACDLDQSDTDTWDDLLERQENELRRISASIDTIENELPDRLKEMQKCVYMLRSRFDKLMFYFQVTSVNPLVLRDILSVIEWFEHRLERLVNPFSSQAVWIDRLMENLTDLSEKVGQDWETIEQQMQTDTKANAETFRSDIERLNQRIRSLQTDMKNGLKPAESFTLLLQKDRDRIKSTYNEALADHLVKRSSSYFDPDAWHQGMESARAWVCYFGMYLLEPAYLKKSGWLIFGAKLAALSALLMVLAGVVLRRLQKRFISLKEDNGLLYFSLSWSIGFGTLMAISSTGLFPSSFFFTAVSVVLAIGLLILSRSLGRIFFSNTRFPFRGLVPLWAAISAAAVLEALHLPETSLTPLWAASLLILWWHYSRLRPSEGEKRGPLRMMITGSMPVLALLALIGWGALSLLLGMSLFLVLLNVRLARCLSEGLRRLGARWQLLEAGDDVAPVVNVRGLGFPLLFVSLLFGSVAWVFVFVAGGSLFMEIVRYRVGWDHFNFSVYRVVCIFALLFAVRGGIALARSAIARLPQRYRDLDTGSVQSLDTLVSYVLWSLFIVSSFGLLGISFRNLAVIAGGLSVGLGFGMQTIVNNFIGGLILLFGRSIQPGDLVEIDNTRGYVRKVTIRNTLVQTFSGATIFVPNSLLVSQKMINWSHGDRKFRQEIRVGVAYGSDVEQVTELLLTAAKQSPKVLSLPPPRVRFLDFGDSTLVFSLRLWIKGWADRYADSEVRYHINRIFRENGIEISFPQLDVHLKSAESLETPTQDRPSDSPPSHP